MDSEVSIYLRAVDTSANLLLIYLVCRSMWFWRRLEFDQKLMAGYYGVSLLFQITLSTLSYYKLTNSYLFHFFTPIEFIFTFSVFALWRQKKKSVILVGSSIYLALFAIVKMFAEQYSTIDAYGIALSSVILIATASMSVAHLAKVNAVGNYRMAFASAIVLYHCGLISSLMLMGVTGNPWLWLLHSISQLAAIIILNFTIPFKIK